MLAYPLSQIMGLSVKLSLFPKECNIANLKQLLGKGSKTYPKNQRPIQLCLYCPKILRNQYITSYKANLERKAYSTYTSQVLDQNFLLILLECYLSNKHFLVSVDGAFSEAFSVQTILGVLFFLKHINDLPETLSKSGSYPYADDMCILQEEKNVHNLKIF